MLLLRIQRKQPNESAKQSKHKRNHTIDNLH